MRSEPTPAAAPAAAPAAPERDLELLWYRLASLRWRALALVAPGRPELASRLMERLLGAVGGARTGLLRGVDATRATPGRIGALCRALERSAARARRERVLVAAPNPVEMPEARELVAACDLSLLVLLRGESRLPDVERTLALLDRSQLLGAVLAHRLRGA